jgi:ubiquitin carboxyl-terminal hydrolase 25/28
VQLFRDTHLIQLTQAEVETYEQALAWLGADASQADDTIVALYGVKVS